MQFNHFMRQSCDVKRPEPGIPEITCSFHHKRMHGIGAASIVFPEIRVVPLFQLWIGTTHKNFWKKMRPAGSCCIMVLMAKINVCLYTPFRQKI
jgi:hypothetical protein